MNEVVYSTPRKRSSEKEFVPHPSSNSKEVGNGDIGGADRRVLAGQCRSSSDSGSKAALLLSRIVHQFRPGRPACGGQE